MVQQWDGKSAPELLALERLDRDLFRNTLNQRNMNDSLFGGQVLAQALTAACATFPETGAGARGVHSLHGYFLRAGRAHTHVVYQVERTRDGDRFSTRRVTAIQQGEPIFHMECGFHAEEEGFEHQQPMRDDIPDPDKLLDLGELAAAWADRLPPWLLERWSQRDKPIDVKPVNPERFLDTGNGEAARRALWIRVPSGATARTAAEQACLLAYLSDYWLSGTAALPHAMPMPSPSLFMASLDHAMWFHRPALVQDWLLFDTDSPSAQNGRGLARGMLFDRGGALVASTAQETLLRARR